MNNKNNILMPRFTQLKTSKIWYEKSKRGRTECEREGKSERKSKRTTGIEGAVNAGGRKVEDKSRMEVKGGKPLMQGFVIGNDILLFLVSFVLVV